MSGFLHLITGPTFFAARRGYTLAVLIGFGAWGCGASSPEPASSPHRAARSASAAAHETELTESDATGEPGSAGASGASHGHSRRSAPEMSCADGSCFRCGEGYCLNGFYCEADERGEGRGCGWVPACATQTTCACLEPMLRKQHGCRCEEKNGGVYVVCAT